MGRGLAAAIKELRLELAAAKRNRAASWDAETRYEYGYEAGLERAIAVLEQEQAALAAK